MEEQLAEIRRKLDHLTDLTGNIEQVLIARHAQQIRADVAAAAAKAAGAAVTVETGEIASEQSPR
jgi:hypothetical protein